MTATGLTLGDAIAYVRTERNLSKRALSERAGLSQSYVQKIESGSVEPSFRVFAQLACALLMTPPEIALLVRSEGTRALGDRNGKT